MRPTDSAKMHLRMAKDMAYKVQISDTDNAMDFRHPLGVCLGSVAYALDDLATGLRATYLLLEEIKQRMDRSGR